MRFLGRPSRLLALLLLLVLVVSSASAREPNRPIKGGKPSSAFTTKNPQWRAGVARLKARAARLAGAKEKQRREASKSSLDDASAVEALAAAKREFPELFTAPLFDGADPEPGMKVVDQRGKGAAVVEDLKTGKRTIAQSNLPLQADDAGVMAPVDLSLETVGDSLKSDNALVPLSVDRTSSADVTFTDAGFSAEVAGKAKDRTVQRAGDRSFFAELRNDTDALIVPTATGAELGIILRSQDAPESQVLDLDLPPGATVRQARSKDPLPNDAPKSLVIRTKKRVLGYIHAPNAFDADDENVPARMTVKGDKVSIEIDHRGRDIRYPVFVDPEINAYGDRDLGWPGWEWGQALREPRNYAVPEGYRAARNDCAYYCGLYQSHPMNTYNANGSYAHWYYRAPVNTFIYRTLFGGIAHDGYDVYGRNHTDSFQGVINSSYSAYEAMQYRNQAGALGPNPFGPAEHDYWGITHDFCQTPDICGPRGNFSEQNYALFGIQTNNKFGCCGLGPAAQQGSTTMAHALVYLGDRQPPTLTGGLPGDRDWRDDNDGVTTITPSARDNGLGLYSFELNGATAGTVTQRVRSTTDSNNDCSGNPHFLPCPANDRDGSANIGYRLPEGANLLSVSGQDAVGNRTATHSWTDRIDRTPPTLSLSGPLFDRRDKAVRSSDFDLSVVARDGDATSRANARSGVKNIEVLVDGTRVAASADQGCPEGSCPAKLDFRFDAANAAEGRHVIEAVATDQLGHRSPSSSFEVYVDKTVPETLSGGELALGEGRTLEPGVYDLSIDATDESDTVPTAGVRSIVVWLDDREIFRKETECVAGGCPMTLDRNLRTQDFPAGRHTVRSETTDEAGNVDFDSFDVYFAEVESRAPDRRTLPVAASVRLDGAQAGDLLGSSMTGLDDVNGDGVTDYAVGAPGASTSGRTQNGAVYVVYGRRGGEPRTTDVSQLSADEGFLIQGAQTAQRSGRSLGAGDFNGDGVGDLAIGAPGPSLPNTSALRSSVYVLFGPLTATDLATASNRSFRILGPTNTTPGPAAPAAAEAVNDLGLLAEPFGSVLAAGPGGLNNIGNTDERGADVNGDGLDDLVVGDASGLSTARPLAGSAYVVFGRTSTADVDASALEAGGYRIDGAAAGDRAGYSVALVGDVDGDGKAEVAVGAPGAPDAAGTSGAGAGYVVYGASSTAPVDLASDGWRGFVTRGGNGDRVGQFSSGVGDMNNDGRFDVAFGGRRVVVPFTPDDQRRTLDTRETPFNGLIVDGDGTSALTVNELGDEDHDGLVDLLVGEASRSASHVVLGVAAPATRNVSALAGQDGYSVSGAEPVQRLGASAKGVGPATGRFAQDSLLGAPTSDANGRLDSGSAFLIEGVQRQTCYDRYVAQPGDEGAVVVCANGDDFVTVNKPNEEPTTRPLAPKAQLRAASGAGDSSGRNRSDRGDTGSRGIVNSRGTEWVVRRTYVGAVINIDPKKSRPILAKLKARIRLTGNTAIHSGYIKPRGSVEQDPDYYSLCREGVGPAATPCKDISPVFKGGTFYSIFGPGVNLEDAFRNMRGPGRFYWDYRLTGKVRPDGPGGQVLSVNYTARPRIFSRPYVCAKRGANQCLFRKPRP